MKLLAVDSNNRQSKSLKDYNKYISKVRLVFFIFTFQFNISMQDDLCELLLTINYYIIL